MHSTRGCKLQPSIALNEKSFKKLDRQPMELKLFMAISIIQYGLGNVASIANIIRKVGGEAILVNQPAELIKADKIILPGVGSFDHAMQLLQDGGWLPVLHQKVLVEERPILGICLGMQLMCKSSEEGKLPGLGWIDASVHRFQFTSTQQLKVPHMGWNVTQAVKENRLLPHWDKTDPTRFYFVHSYYVRCTHSQDILATTNYGGDFTTAFSHENMMGVQFHPEKSHRYGMQFFSNFIQL